MPLTTEIAAPIERVFDLARDVDLHLSSMAGHRETAVAGVISGLIGDGEEVTWRAHHLGRWFELTSRVTAFEPPMYFRDSMVRGPLDRFDHEHYFKTKEPGTVMLDVFDYAAPFGLLGRLADALFLRRYLESLLEQRTDAIKSAAERG